MAKIIFSKVARLDLKDIIDYIKRDSVKYAYIEKQKIVDAVQKLLKYPTLGRIVPEINEENVREIFVGNYRIIYENISDQLTIISIHHHARLIRNNPAFNEQDWKARLINQ